MSVTAANPGHTALELRDAAVLLGNKKRRRSAVFDLGILEFERMTPW